MPATRQIAATDVRPLVGSTPYIGQVATRGRYSEGRFASPNTLIRSSIFHRARARITDGTQFRYDNFYGSGESGSGGTLVIGRVDIEYPIGGGAFYPLAFAGSPSANVADQASVTGTLAGVTIPDGAPFREWVVATFTNGALYANTSPLVDIAQVGSSFASTVPGITTGMGGAQQVYGATAILGPTTKPSVLLLGDSRLSGGGNFHGNNDLGSLARAIGTTCGYINLGCSGAAMWQFRVNATARLTGLAAFCSHVVHAGHVNDLIGGDTAAACKTNVEGLIAKFGAGKINAVCTVEPYTTGAWTAPDLSDQTIWDTARNTQRVAYNNTVRGGEVVGADFMFDLAEAVESSRDGGKWMAGYTDDGLHANTRGQLRFLQFVNPALLGTVAYP